MRIVVAPDSFKGSLTAREVCDAAREGILRAMPDADVIAVPMADGGEGTVQSLVDATGGRFVTKRVFGPLGAPVDARFGILGDGETAVIEMAAASGLPLVPPEQRDTMRATTYGTGELIRAALDEGARRLIVGIGGSATTDGGAGMAQALGVEFLGEDGQPLVCGLAGGGLEDLVRIELSGLDPRISGVETVVACDVDNPLCGPRGAAHVYGPQKGATPEQVEVLDRNLAHFADVVQRDLRKSVRDLPGSGAAGGLGAGLVAFLDAELRAGVDIMIEATELRQHLGSADLVITGEGCLDPQTLHGKTPMGVARAAKEFALPVIALGGSISDDADALSNSDIDALVSITDGPMTLQEAMDPANANRLVARAAERAMGLVEAGRSMTARRGEILRYAQNDT